MMSHPVIRLVKWLRPKEKENVELDNDLLFVSFVENPTEDPENEETTEQARELAKELAKELTKEQANEQ